jgi:PAS domain S-box-containing protein
VEEALRLSEARYRTASELVSDYAYAVRIESDGRAELEWITDAFSRITGFSRQELEAREGIAWLIHPEDLPGVQQRLQALFTGQPGSSEHRIITKSGDVRWLRDYSSPEWDAAHERIVRIIGAGQDITAHKQAEEANLRLAAIVESSDDAIVSKSLEGIVTSWNAAAEHIFGYRPEEMIGHSIRRLLPEDRQDEEDMILARLRRGERVDHFETVRRTKDGRLLDVSVTISPLRDARGTIIGASKIARDISARRQTEEALRESEARCRALANAVPAMVWTAAPDGTITYASEQWLQYCGITLEQNAGQWPALVLHPDDQDRCLTRWAQALEQGTDYEIEVRNRRFDGQYRWFLTRAVPARDAAGHITAWYGTTTDIHDRKRMEETLVRQAAELQRSNVELQQFAYVVAHDLQEPLRTITNYVQLLARYSRDRLDAEANEFIEFAVDGAQRLLQLITALLTYTRVGNQESRFTAVDCEGLLAQTLSDLRLAITDSNAEVTHDPLPTVRGDAAQLGLVLQNLIGNALKFHGEASPRIHISAWREGTQWVFSVQDNGIGIDPKQAERIFRVFQRLHTRKEYPGTGIGLAICKKIVERHGGRIWVESAPGTGATFFFTLPTRRGTDEVLSQSWM